MEQICILKLFPQIQFAPWADCVWYFPGSSSGLRVEAQKKSALFGADWQRTLPS